MSSSKDPISTALALARMLDAKATLAKIENNYYNSAVKNHANVKSIIKIGIAFCGKNCGQTYCC